MYIGVPAEIKNNEYRVGLIPAAVGELVQHGHQVIIETNAGQGTGHADDNYRRVGATIAADAKSVFSEAERIIKIKEPQKTERKMLGPDHTLFTYLHPAPCTLHQTGN